MSQLATRALERGSHRAGWLSPLLTTLALGLLLVAGRASASELGDLPSFRAPTFTTSALTPSSNRNKAPCDQPECVQGKLDVLATVRLTGEFGRFTGRVSRWSADSLSGFMSDPNWGGTAPQAPLNWLQIHQVDKRVSNSGRGSVIGALALGTLGVVVAVAIEAATHNHTSALLGEAPDYTRAGLIGGGIGVVVGAGLGATIGSTSNHWAPVYLRR